MVPVKLQITGIRSFRQDYRSLASEVPDKMFSTTTDLLYSVACWNFSSLNDIWFQSTTLWAFETLNIMNYSDYHFKVCCIFPLEIDNLLQHAIFPTNLHKMHAITPSQKTWLVKICWEAAKKKSIPWVQTTGK